MSKTLNKRVHQYSDMDPSLEQIREPDPKIVPGEFTRKSETRNSYAFGQNKYPHSRLDLEEFIRDY